MESYTPGRSRPERRKKNLTLSTREYNKVCCLNSVFATKLPIDACRLQERSRLCGRQENTSMVPMFGMESIHGQHRGLVD